MIRLTVAAAFAALCITSAAAQAQTAPPSALRNACRADVQKLCAGVERGEGRIARCMRDKQAELSAPCKEQMASARQRVQSAQAACKDDVQKHCAGVQPGGGRIVQCLQAKQTELSQSCRDARPQRPRG